MKVVSAAFLVVIAGLWTKASLAEMTAEQAELVKAFVAGVHALDPHTEESEPAFQALVAKYVPASGPVQAYLDFLTASGFKCPWKHSLSEEIDRETPTYRCTFKPDLGATAKPSLSSVTEVAWFGVTADCDKNRNIVKVEGYMVHGFTGP